MARSSRATTQGKAGKSDARADAPATPQTPQEAPAAAPAPAPEVPGPRLTRVYAIQADALLMPGGAGEWKERVTQADLDAAGADVAWLLRIGVIVDSGLVAL